MKKLEGLKEYIDAILDLIYPPVTIEDICDKPLPFIKEHNCTKCSIPLRMIEDGPMCEECKNSNHYFNRAISVVQYEENVKKLIYQFKYSNQTYLARNMASLMVNKLKEEDIEVDLILPIPLYKDKEKERGFNQAALLGKYIGKETKIPFNTNTLIRVKNTKVMHQLNKKERYENVNNAFKVLNKGVLKDKNILLIDDIFTTGSTANACSKLLLNSGAKCVNILTFARD